MSREDTPNLYIKNIILEARRIVARDDEWLKEGNEHWIYMPSNLLRLQLSRFDKYMAEKGEKDEPR